MTVESKRRLAEVLDGVSDTALENYLTERRRKRYKPPPEPLKEPDFRPLQEAVAAFVQEVAASRVVRRDAARQITETALNCIYAPSDIGTWLRNIGREDT